LSTRRRPAAAARGAFRPDKKILDATGGVKPAPRKIRRLARLRAWHRTCESSARRTRFHHVLDAFTKRVVRALAAYWRDNPFACDTAEGIRQWWLSPAEEASSEQVNRALAWLCDRGLVERLLPADGRGRFRRSGGSDTALRLLAQSGDPGETPSRALH